MRLTEVTLTGRCKHLDSGETFTAATLERLDVLQTIFKSSRYEVRLIVYAFASTEHSLTIFRGFLRSLAWEASAVCLAKADLASGAFRETSIMRSFTRDAFSLGTDQAVRASELGG